MDKAEYKTKLENISALAENGSYKEAAAAADEVDWKRVRSVRTLCMIAEIYSANKRYNDALLLLVQAYRRSPSARTVLYGLAETEIRLGDFQAAEKYINEFEQNAPGDSSDYILKYKLLRAKQAPLDDQIKVLRDYKELEYTERWAYELAKLYKKNGQKEKCVEECDDLILWFGEGRYVKKALELKKTLQALSPVQQKILNHMLEEEKSTSTEGASNKEKNEAENKNIKALAEETMRKLDMAAGSVVGNAKGGAVQEAPEGEANGYAEGFVPGDGELSAASADDHAGSLTMGAQALETRAKKSGQDALMVNAAASEPVSDAEETPVAETPAEDAAAREETEHSVPAETEPAAKLTGEPAEAETAAQEKAAALTAGETAEAEPAAKEEDAPENTGEAAEKAAAQEETAPENPREPAEAETAAQEKAAALTAGEAAEEAEPQAEDAPENTGEAAEEAAAQEETAPENPREPAEAEPAAQEKAISLIPGEADAEEAERERASDNTTEENPEDLFDIKGALKHAETSADTSSENDVSAAQTAALKAALASDDTHGMEQGIIRTGYEEAGLTAAHETQEEDEVAEIRNLLPDSDENGESVPALEDESDAGGRTVRKTAKKPGLFARIADSLRLEDNEDEEDQMASALSAAESKHVLKKETDGDEIAESLEKAELGTKAPGKFSDTVGRLERAGNAASYQSEDDLARRTRYSAFTGAVTKAGSREISAPGELLAGREGRDPDQADTEAENKDADVSDTASDEKKREGSGRSGDQTPGSDFAESPAKRTGDTEQAGFSETTSRPMTDEELQQLFNETTSQLKNDIAGGGYELTDTIKGDADVSRQQNAAQSEKNAGKVHELLGRETDESLGLTREINYKSIEQALQSGKKAGGSAAAGAIPDPDSAARATAFEANGKPLPADDVDASVGTVSGYGEGEMTDEELLEALNIDDEAKRELMADASDEPGGEKTSENLMDMSTVSPVAQEENRSIIENIMEKPNVYTRLPLEGRRFTDAEKKAFSYFAQVPGVDYQVTTAIADIHNNCGDKTSRSGNVVIMGRQGSGKTRLAEGLVMAACMNLGMKACKFAHLVSDEMNAKDPAAVVAKLSGGFLLIEAAGGLDDRTINGLNQAMEFRTDDLIVILEDEKADMRKMLDAHPDFAKKFTSIITVPVFMNDELVTFAKTYAKEQGYKLDELATLALYTIIGENQRDDEPVTVGRVKRVVDKAIEKNSRKLFGKAQDSADGRILLREKDFNF